VTHFWLVTFRKKPVEQTQTPLASATALAEQQILDGPVGVVPVGHAHARMAGS